MHPKILEIGERLKRRAEEERKKFEAVARECEGCGRKFWPDYLERRNGLCEWCYEEKRERERQEERRRWLESLRVDVDAASEALARIGVPKRYRRYHRTLWQGPWPPEVQRWIDLGEHRGSEAPFLLLWGPTGTGKTFLAACVALDLYARREGVWWISAQRMIEQLHEEIGRRDDDDSEPLLERLRAADVLVIDDLGSELLAQDRSGWRIERLSYLLCSRYDDCRPTVITSNLSVAKWSAYSARLASRFADGLVLARGGADWRVTREAAR